MTSDVVDKLYSLILCLNAYCIAPKSFNVLQTDASDFALVIFRFSSNGSVSMGYHGIFSGGGQISGLETKVTMEPHWGLGSKPPEADDMFWK